MFRETDYKLSTRQVSNPLVIQIKFYRGFYKTPQKSIMMSLFSQYWTFKIAYFVELNRGYQPAEFHWPRLSALNFTRAGGKHPTPQTYTLSKNPVLMGLKAEISTSQPGADVYILFCGPMFVPAFVLSQPSFKVNKPTFWDRSLCRRNLQKNNIDVPMFIFFLKGTCMYVLQCLSPFELILN